MDVGIKHILVLGFTMMVALTLVFTVPGEKGLLQTMKLKKELVVLRTQNVEMKRENQMLAQEAGLLKESLPYIEHVITREMNMVRPGDTIVIIKKKK
jgi:cell division protein FtsB